MWTDRGRCLVPDLNPDLRRTRVCFSSRTNPPRLALGRPRTSNVSIIGSSESALSRLISPAVEIDTDFPPLNQGSQPRSAMNPHGMRAHFHSQGLKEVVQPPRMTIVMAQIHLSLPSTLVSGSRVGPKILKLLPSGLPDVRLCHSHLPRNRL